MDYIAIDFDASCLRRHGRAFPIEMGIAGTDCVGSCLIQPDPARQGWDWTDNAFGLHGISRAQLFDESVAPETVVAELLEAATDPPCLWGPSSTVSHDSSYIA